MQPAPHATDPYATSQKKLWTWIACGGLVLAVVVGWSWGAGLLFQGGRGSANLGQSGSGNAVLKQQGSPQAVLPVPAEAKQMPADIYNWLKHLEETEDRQKKLVNDQIASFAIMKTKIEGVGSVGIYDGMVEGDVDRATDDFDQHEMRDQTKNEKARWEELQTFFESVPPPAECIPIATQYSSAMIETQGMMLEVVGLMDKISTDPQAALSALMGMKSTSGGRIDEGRKESDRLVGTICSKYDTRKWFSIPPDIGMGGILGQAGGMPAIPNLSP